MREPTAIRGMTPGEALSAVARWASVERAPEETSTDDAPDSSDAIAAALQAHGVHARASEIVGRDLPFLQPPALVGLRDRTWLLLRRPKAGGFEAEAADGVCAVSHRRLAAAASGAVVEISPSVPKERRWWARACVWTALAHPGTAVQIVLATVLLQLLALAIPELTALVMNRALPDGAGATLVVLASAVVLVAGAQAWTGLIRERGLLFLMARLEVATQRTLLWHVLRQPFPSLHRARRGELLETFLGVAAAREQLGERAIAALLDSAMALGFLVAMWWKLPGPAVLAAAVACVLGALAIPISRALARLVTSEVDAQARQRHYATELLEGVATIKAAGAEGQFLLRWLRLLRREQEVALARLRIAGWTEAVADPARNGVTCVALVWGGFAILDGRVMPGTLIAFLQLCSAFFVAVLQALSTYASAVSVRPQLARVEETLRLEPERDLPRRMTAVRGASVAVDGVWFRYRPEAPWVLRGKRLHVPQGTVRKVGGASGSGKSTLLRLVADLYRPERGTISVGGLSPEAARDRILYVPQFTHFHSGSIISNMQTLSIGASRSRIEEAARTTGLADLVAALPMGYETVLSLGGGGLSGGQRQLVALTAAIASDRPVLLLDEPFANVDPEAALFLDGVLAQLGRTVILVHHQAASDAPGSVAGPSALRARS